MTTVTIDRLTCDLIISPIYITANATSPQGCKLYSIQERLVITCTDHKYFEQNLIECEKALSEHRTTATNELIEMLKLDMKIAKTTVAKG